MISGNVFYIQADSLSKILLPPFLGFSRQSVYEVDTDILITGFPASADGLGGSPGIMAAFQ